MKVNLKNVPVSAFKQKAFTLIEVMAAVAVFAISAAGLYSINQQNVFLADRLESRTVAHWLALNAYNELAITKDYPGAGEQSVKKKMAHTEWTVRTKIEGTPLESVRRVTMVVEGGNGQEYARMVGFVGRNALETTIDSGMFN